MCPTRTRDDTMKEYICPVCQKSFKEGAVPEKCPECGCTKDLFNELGEPELQDVLSESKSFKEEYSANGLAEYTTSIGVLVGLAGVITGIVFMTDDNYHLGAYFLIGGVLACLISLLSWCIIKLLVKISYHLTHMDEKSDCQMPVKSKQVAKK